MLLARRKSLLAFIGNPGFNQTVVRLVQCSNNTQGVGAPVPLISPPRYQQQMVNQHTFQNVPRNQSHRIYGKQVTGM